MGNLSLQLCLSTLQVNSFPLGKALKIKKKLVPIVSRISVPGQWSILVFTVPTTVGPAKNPCPNLQHKSGTMERDAHDIYTLLSHYSNKYPTQLKIHPLLWSRIFVTAQTPACILTFSMLTHIHTHAHHIRYLFI